MKERLRYYNRLYTIVTKHTQEAKEKINKDWKLKNLLFSLTSRQKNIDIKKKNKVGDLGQEWPEGSLFNSYNIEV